MGNLFCNQRLWLHLSLYVLWQLWPFWPSLPRWSSLPLLYPIEEKVYEGRISFTRFGKAISKIGASILQRVLESFIPPKDIVIKVKETYPGLLYELKPSQKDIFERAATNGYKDFNVYICYILLRDVCTSLGLIPMPSHGWGSNPKEDDATISADIERIRILYDYVHHNLDKCYIPKTQFKANWGQLNGICTRMEKQYPDTKDLTQELLTLENCRLSETDDESMIEQFTEIADQRNYLKHLLVTPQDIRCKEVSSGKDVIITYDRKLPENRITREFDNYTGIDVIRRNPYSVSYDAAFTSNNRISENISIPVSELQTLKECIEANAQSLWDKHSNLTIITGDCIKSVEKDTVRETCIVLYCLSKGFIPENEEFFPKELSFDLGTFKTDVREGYFTLGPTHRYGVLDAYNDPICMGSNIGNNLKDSSGSLGLFVDLPQNKMGFITCCHVLFDCITPEFFCYVRGDKPYSICIIQPGNASLSGREKKERECGRIEKAIFDPRISPVSVDAALVEINTRQPSTGHLVIKDHTQTRELGFSKDESPVFDTGEVRRNIRPQDHDKPLLKSGTSTGLTRSLFRMDGAQVRIFKEGAWLGSKDQKAIVMKRQYEVEGGIINKTFFEPGDSGSAVFIKEPEGQLACIGIAIGKTSYGTTVVTPIGDVLDALGLQDSDVTKFIAKN